MTSSPLSPLSSGILHQLSEQSDDIDLLRLQRPDYDEIAGNSFQALTSLDEEVIKDAMMYETTLVLASAPQDGWANVLLGLHRDKGFLIGPIDDDNRRLKRSDDGETGIRFFDQNRSEQIRIHTFQLFLQRFDEVSNNVLSGLDFNNVLVAGSSVLSSLTSTENGGRAFRPADIDIFFFGLDSEKAIEKAYAIAETVFSNVPNCHEEYARTMNANTITLRSIKGNSSFPTIQIILRLYDNPAEILANFDLDPCAVGFSGCEVWIEPRAVRAIHTGLSVLTEKLLKTTTLRRIMKYASRGYGLVLRPREQDDDPHDIKKLSVRASKAYDWISAQVKAGRDKKDLWIPPHRTSSPADVFAKGPNRGRGGWLGTYSSFTMAAAFWDHMVGHCTKRMLDGVDAVVDPETFETGDIIDYNQHWPLEDAEEWEDAVRQAYGLGHNLKIKESVFRGIESKVPGLGGLIHSLKFVIFLPLGFIQSQDVNLWPFAYEDLLYRVAGTPLISDTDGNGFELCIWEVDHTKTWEPTDPEGRILHQFLKRAVALTTWTLSECYTGASWPKLCYGTRLRRLAKDIRFEVDAEEAYTDLHRWIHS
ncbi:hypothetical protein CF319_g5023 [Tilletia indica]|nr:hypothetical protein CF319_g5023 [Tilletia indica]